MNTTWQAEIERIQLRQEEARAFVDEQHRLMMEAAKAPFSYWKTTAICMAFGAASVAVGVLIARMI